MQVISAVSQVDSGSACLQMGDQLVTTPEDSGEENETV